ncbi:glycosyltransferase family 9 protein [Viscerimonas tarda]
MSFKAKINHLRRRTMLGLTYYIDRLYKNQKGVLTNDEVKRILVCRPNNRLGNLLLITSLIQELSDTFPNAAIDLFVRGNLAPILFENYRNVDRIIKLPPKPFKELLNYLGVWGRLRKYKYDIAINVVPNSSSGRLSTCFSRSRFKFPGDLNDEIPPENEDLQHIAKYPIYSIRKNLSRFGIEDKQKPAPTMNIQLSPDELAKGKETLAQITPEPNKETIGIYTYATGGKCYSKDWWKVVYENLTADYGETYNIVEILPKENVSQIDFRAPSWYSLDIRGMAAVIANMKIFISADCGVMHLASAAQTPTVGLFSGSNIKKYCPYNPGSIAIDTNTIQVQSLRLKV